MDASEYELVVETLAQFEHRPLDFAYWAFPWREPDTDLEFRDGLEAWQEKLLRAVQDRILTMEEALRIAVRSGHGVGKSALLCIIILWAISTKVDTRGRVTANTEKQLLRTLWPELAKWHRLFIARDLFKVTATSIFADVPGREKEWRIDAIPWSENNPEAFAGLHNYGKRILVICDEASGIPNVIWETLDGATLDANTEILWIVCGNPTKAVGRFRECFEQRSNEWTTFHVDSRDVSFTNKAQIERAIERYGVDNDYVKVRYLGEFPSVEASALFAPDTIRTAQVRELISTFAEPLIMGVDVARYGNNESVIFFRRGRDARSKEIIRRRGVSTVELGSLVASLIASESPDAVFIDEGGVGGGVIDFVRHLGHSCIGVNFGSKPSSSPEGVLVADKRAEMYVLCQQWLRTGGCLPEDSDVYDQLSQIEYYINKKSAIMLVSKEDMRSAGKESPDLIDALVLTFAFPVSATKYRGARKLEYEYDPYALPDEARGARMSLRDGPYRYEGVH